MSKKIERDVLPVTRSPYTAAEFAARNRAAYRDVDLIASGRQPTDSDLSGAPILDGYLVELVAPGAYVLVGSVTGHPRLRDGLITTSPVLAIDQSPEPRWVRTAGRYYVLGRPYAPPEPTAETVPEVEVAEEFPEDDQQNLWRP